MTEPTDRDRELAREAVLSCPTVPCGTYAEMAEWRKSKWIEPYAKAIAAAREEGRQEERKRGVKHTLHLIGWLGMKTAYLDISAEEAKRRYAKDNEGDAGAIDTIETFEIDDEFRCYDAWPPT